MDALIRGYRQFRREMWPRERERFRSLSQRGQRPRALVIACSDSRVDPQMIFSAAPGELFVVRNVANLVPPYAPDASYHGTSAALEFGVRELEVQQIIVMGHALCGGAQALLDRTPSHVRDFVDPWMKIAEAARQRSIEHETAEARQQACEHEIIRVSIENLKTFPWIRQAVEAGRLTVHGCYFDIRSGILLRIGPTGAFEPVVGANT
jgi:carbonic anhydrase